MAQKNIAFAIAVILISLSIYYDWYLNHKPPAPMWWYMMLSAVIFERTETAKILIEYMKLLITKLVQKI